MAGPVVEKEPQTPNKDRPLTPNSGGTGGEGSSDTASLPLYLAGLVITLCGILAANAALPSPDYSWMLDTVLLTSLGFLFSFGCRRLGISGRQVDYGLAALALLLLAGVETGQLALEQFLPIGTDRGGLRLLATLAWGATFWAWALRSDVRVMLTTVPAMAALGLAAEEDLNDPVLACFGIFILTVIFLLIHQNYLQNRSRAALPERERASARLLPAQFAQTAVCALVVLLTGLIVIVPAQAVFARLSLAQAIRHLAGLGHAGPTPGNAGPALFRRRQPGASAPAMLGRPAPKWSCASRPATGRSICGAGVPMTTTRATGWQSSQENEKTALSEGSPGDGGWSYAVPDGLTPGDRCADARRARR